MAVVRTTGTKHQWRCHYFWGCGKWSDPRMTTLWLPGALFQPPFGIFILRKPFVGTCAQVWKGSEGQWTMSPHPHPLTPTAAPPHVWALEWWLLLKDSSSFARGLESVYNDCSPGISNLNCKEPRPQLMSTGRAEMAVFLACLSLSSKR